MSTLADYVILRDQDGDSWLHRSYMESSVQVTVSGDRKPTTYRPSSPLLIEVGEGQRVGEVWNAVPKLADRICLRVPA